MTSLRFVAAFAVLLLHYRDLLGPMPAWLRQGFVGVIVLASALHALAYYGLNYRFTVQAETQYIVTVYNPLLRWGEFLAGCLAGQYFMRSRAAAGRAGGLLPGSILDSLLGAGLGSMRARSLLVCVCMVAVAARVWTSAYTGPSAA